MKQKISKQFRSMLSVVVLMICMMAATTMTAFARHREIIPADSGNSLNMSVSDSGTLTWDDVPGATGYRVVLTQPNITELYHWDVTDNCLTLITEMDGYKCDSGQYIISVAAKGVSGVDDTMYYYYTSHVDKLEAPENLVWIGDKAAWDAVEGATSYNLSLYDFNGHVVTIPTTSCLYDFSGNAPQDGWTFRVQALSNGTMYSERYSNYVESPARGSRTRTITPVNSGNSLNMKISSSGTLTWDDISGANGYRVVLTQPNITELYHWDVSNSYLNLTTEMDGYKCDSGQYIVAVTAKGVSGVDDTMYYYYTSHVDKLESPKRLLWIGDKAAWDAVEGATSYNLSLYDFNGHVVTIPTTETLYDFSGSLPQGGWTFRVQALSNGTWSAKRNSSYTESPAKEKLLPTTFYNIGAYVYDDTHETLDSGGQVSLTTDFGTDSWSDSGYIKQATEGTTVTLNAEPAPGYVFVEWRQGTGGTTISTDAYYQFTVSEHKYLYAIFREEGSTGNLPEGAGSSADNPIVCYSYAEFKYAMENEDIRYVVLGNINETMPVGEEGLVTAIHVNGIKNLRLLGDATFTAPVSDVTTYAALLHTTQNDTLNINGTGSLTFRAVANDSYNAVIYNQGGSVNISGGTLIGSYNVAVYGKAIWQAYGELRISGGQFFAENALAPSTLPRSKSAVTLEGGQTWIQGGTFKTENIIDTIDLPFGLDIGQNATVDLSGGIFYGIQLPTSSTPLANYMDEDLYSSLTNDSTFDPESEYSQEYTASGKLVRIAWLIDHVDVHINAPVAGVDITENYFNIPTSGCQVTMYYPQWYKNGELVTYGTFEAGASYKVVVQIDAKSDYDAEFTKNVTVSINNKSVNVDRKSGHWLEVEYDFGECSAAVGTVALTVTAPKEGQNPSYIIGCESDAYYAVGGSSNYTEYRQWYMSSDNDDWWEIGPNHQFMSGYYYKLYVDIRTNNGYEFPLYDSGSNGIQPNVSATVNGYHANVFKAYDQEPSRYITVEYNFGECNDSIVEKIIVENVTAPVAGEYPNYNYSIRGNGYRMDTARNSYYDDWQNNQKLYYVKNGLQWWDTTTGSWEYVYENQKFLPGHTYDCQLYLLREDGYEFAYDDGPKVTATINGKSAEINEDWTDRFEARVYGSFTCEKKDVSTVMLYDLDTPQAGKVPDRMVTAAYPELYTVETITWYDCEDNPLLGEDTFLQGEQYKVEIKIVPTKEEEVNICQFVAPVRAYINGEEVTERLNWDRIDASSDAVYVYYTFFKGAAAPEIAGVTVSGDVTSFGSDEDDVTVQLIRQGEDTPNYQVVVEGGSTAYSMSDVASGIYTLRVSKANHVTRDYEITVVGQNVVQGAKICLLGDVNTDGGVDYGDLQRLYQHLATNNKLVDYGLEIAKINNDTNVDYGDLQRLYQHLSTNNKLF